MNVVKRREKNPTRTCWDIYITRGDSGYLTFSLTDESSQPIELRDEDIVRCQVRKKADGGELIFNGVIERTEEEILWHIMPSDTQELESGEYVWDAEFFLYDVGDNFTFIPESKFIVLPSVTEPEV